MLALLQRIPTKEALLPHTVRVQTAIRGKRNHASFTTEIEGIAVSSHGMASCQVQDYSLWKVVIEGRASVGKTGHDAREY